MPKALSTLTTKMFNRNVPAPGPRSRDPIVIDDESEDEDMNVDYPGRQNQPRGVDPSKPFMPLH